MHYCYKPFSTQSDASGDHIPHFNFVIEGPPFVESKSLWRFGRIENAYRKDLPIHALQNIPSRFYNFMETTGEIPVTFSFLILHPDRILRDDF